MQSSFAEGWDEAAERLSEFSGSFVGDRYGKISDSIRILQDDINHFNGYSTGSGQLSGDVAEFWHAGTHNINAALKDSQFKVTVDRSHEFASADLTSNWGDKFGLKYLRDANKSSNAQAISYFQRFKEFQSSSNQPNLSFQEFLSLKGIPEGDIMNDPIYAGQIRIIPSDQYEEAVSYLKVKIAKESMTRPEQVARYKDTLENLQKAVRDPDGIPSTELSKEDAKIFADQAKKGKFKVYDTEFTPKDLIKFNDIVNQGLKAGATAATITFFMKMAPEIIHVVTDMIKIGEVDLNKFKKVGFEALPAASESFLRGFVASSFTFAYESGKLGNFLQNVKPEQVPSIIGAITVIAMSTIKDSVLCAQGKLSRQELATNLIKNTFVSGCAIGLGALLQFALPAIPCAYFIGNAVGTIIGSLSFSLIDNIFVALCVEKGYTFFGLVDQNYELPDEVLNELGVDWSSVDELSVDLIDYDESEIDEQLLEQCDLDYVKMVRRGVFKVHHVGYYYD